MAANVSSSLQLAGRVLLALFFVLAGVEKLGGPAATAAFMASGGLPDSPALAGLVGTLQVLAGLALLVGFCARWAAVALAAFTVAVSLVFHAYWWVSADQQFIQQLFFNKNMAIVGGLLVLAATGPGAWSWDARRAAALPALSRRGV